MMFIDQEIAHIMRVMVPSLLTDGTVPILSVEYWHRRLSNLLDSAQLSQTQFRTIDSLMTQLERLQLEPRLAA
ncbi:hypothetical protein B0G62_1107 [Paraburkholderia eburnea]|uniref:Uncharacterized protein n=1 Tax=Paraburkholderia eburnea TaxID=1189126 RepID=A0A2S4M4R5_9BURK|nr:hypothetical protein [Paraburkholderia eburnea]POR49701.1 hypothetical protein B0G62_1107 [Paraburkholderia eburnea]PRZ20129.1 hypothetical protein BX588_1127 [Paraburkholderia eburnea]